MTVLGGFMAYDRGRIYRLIVYPPSSHGRPRVHGSTLQSSITDCEKMVVLLGDTRAIARPFPFMVSVIDFFDRLPPPLDE